MKWCYFAAVSSQKLAKKYVQSLLAAWKPIAEVSLNPNLNNERTFKFEWVFERLAQFKVLAGDDWHVLISCKQIDIQ